MKITGQITVPAQRSRVFAALRDAHFFAGCVDGVRDLTEVDGTHYTAMLETKVAYMAFRFNVTVELTRIEPPELIEARITGTPAGIIGRLTATSTTRLHQQGDGTLIDYDIESVLTGKLGSIGQPVLRAKAKDMERAFTTRIGAAFAQLRRMLDLRQGRHGADAKASIRQCRKGGERFLDRAQADQARGTKHPGPHHQHQGRAPSHHAHRRVLWIKQIHGTSQCGWNFQLECIHGVLPVVAGCANAARIRVVNWRSMSFAFARRTGWPMLPSLPVKTDSMV